jgi:hypothetical protein
MKSGEFQFQVHAVSNEEGGRKRSPYESAVAFEFATA